MTMSPTFWTAFYAGLTAPTALFGPVPGYTTLVSIPTPAQSFAAVGALLSGVSEAEGKRR